MSLVDCTFVLIACVLLNSSVGIAKPTNIVPDQKVEILKQKILSSLGYKEPPVIRNISDSIQQQRAMIRKYREHIKGNSAVEEERYPETLSVYKPKDSVQLDDNQTKSKMLLNFDIEEKHPDDPHVETVISRAHIKIYLKEAKNSSTQIQIHSDFNSDNFNLLTNHLVFSNVKQNVKTVYLDITTLLRSWLEHPSAQFGIAVSFSANISDILQISSKSLSDNGLQLNFQSGFEPELEVFSYQRPILGREKRQSDTTSRRDCVKGDGENRCCRFRTYISFADIGWDNWIIKPSGYEAYYCSGECPHRFKMANTFAGIKSLLHIKNPSTFSPPCCVPSKLSPFTILHRDENGQYAFMDLDDMVVEDCKCA